MKPEIPEVDPEMPQNAISVYGQDPGAEDFPVLKAFQQYIDAEQEKARKRMLTMAVFFGLFTLCVVAVFVALLMYVSARNQSLNDRLVEFAMRERNQPVHTTSSPVVVQPPQDSSAILALTAKLDEMQKKLAADQAKAEREAKEAAARAEKAAIEAAKPKGPTKEELEILKLKEEINQRKITEAKRIAEAKKLAQEKAKLEKEAKRQAEIEAYRRKNYPELYQTTVKKKTNPRVDAVLKELDDTKAITYFDDDEDDDMAGRQKVPAKTRKKAKSPSADIDDSIPVDAKGSDSDRSWSIPED